MVGSNGVYQRLMKWDARCTFGAAAGLMAEKAIVAIWGLKLSAARNMLIRSK